MCSQKKKQPSACQQRQQRDFPTDRGKMDIDNNEELDKEVWRDALIDLWSRKRHKGCAYFGGPNIAEWHPTEELLREIAKKLNRNYKTEMTDNLKQFLTAVTVKYYKYLDRNW